MTMTNMGADMTPGGSSRPIFLPRLLAISRKILATLASVFVTMLGLLLITFLIGRVMPIDPVLAIVGEKPAPQPMKPPLLLLALTSRYWSNLAIIFAMFFTVTLVTRF